MFKQQTLLSISNLSTEIGNTKILNAISLKINSGEIHTLIGQNGSGKSSLAFTIMGHPVYKATHGTIIFDNQNLLPLLPYERARLGLFLSFQQPISVPGLKVLTFLKEIYRLTTDISYSEYHFQKSTEKYLDFLCIDHEWLERNVNENFSGGEKKKLELLQMMIAKPKLAILDEIDSGMDSKTIGTLTNAICLMRKENPSLSLLIISHDIKRLHPIVADITHTMHNGNVIS